MARPVKSRRDCTQASNVTIQETSHTPQGFLPHVSYHERGHTNREVEREYGHLHHTAITTTISSTIVFHNNIILHHHIKYHTHKSGEMREKMRVY